MEARTSIAMKVEATNIGRGVRAQLAPRTAPTTPTAPATRAITTMRRQSLSHPPAYLCLEDACPGEGARCAGSEGQSRSCAWGLVVSYQRPLLLLLWAPPGAPFQS